MDYVGVQLWGLIELSLSLLITSDCSSHHQDSISVSQSSSAVSRPTGHSSGPLIITVPIIILPRFLLNIINTISVSRVRVMRTYDSSNGYVPNIDSDHRIRTFKRFEMLFDLMIILVSDLTNKNGLTLDTNSLISLTSIHYQF